MSNWIVELLKQIIVQMTPGIRNELVECVNKMAEKAKKNDNPWDDVAVGLLKFVLFIK